eukprot:875591-Pyramimonas_sp.AAC.1
MPPVMICTPPSWTPPSWSLPSRSTEHCRYVVHSEFASVGVLADSCGKMRFATDFRGPPWCLGARVPRCPGAL